MRGHYTPNCAGQQPTMPADSPPHHLDSATIRRHFSRVAQRERPLAVLEREVAARMYERLDYIRIQPQQALDLGCGRGDDLRELVARYPECTWLGVDNAASMLDGNAAPRTGWLQRLLPGKRAPVQHRLCADAGALPLVARRFDMVWSNLALLWLNDPLPVFHEMQRVLKIGGMLMFSTLGPDTLKPLREALGDAADLHLHRFIDMHDLGDALVNAGFADPVMDMQIVTLRYSRPELLFDDLRQSGWHNALTARPRGLGQRRRWQQVRNALIALADHNGSLDIPFEIIQGHAWKPEPRVTDDGRAIIHFQPRAERPA